MWNRQGLSAAAGKMSKGLFRGNSLSEFWRRYPRSVSLWRRPIHPGRGPGPVDPMPGEQSRRDRTLLIGSAPCNAVPFLETREQERRTGLEEGWWQSGRSSPSSPHWPAEAHRVTLWVHFMSQYPLRNHRNGCHGRQDGSTDSARARSALFWPSSK